MTLQHEYFFEIDLHGGVHHEGDEVKDIHFLDFFFRQMRPNPTGRHEEYPYYSPCERDRNFIRAADTPIVFHRLTENYLEYGGALTYPFEPEELRFSSDGILYHRAPVGEFGRIAPAAVMKLAESIAPFGPYYALTMNGKTDIIEPLFPPEHLRVLRPRPGNMCAGCGAENSAGFRLSFLYDSSEQTAHSWLTPDSRMAGSLGIMHGGYVSLLLDEVMGKVLAGKGIQAPTARLNVEFRRPVQLGGEIELRGRLIGESGRKFTLGGTILSANGTILAEAEGLFIGRAV